MLISHPRKFIYLKTRKTGGTSVEIYFEPWCQEPGLATPARHFREAQQSEWGIVGSRDVNNHALWYNHAPAVEIRQRLGEAVWQEYFKFCVVRNPFDKSVSSFWFQLHPAVRELLAHTDFAVVRKTFAEWIRRAPLPLDHSIYTIGNEIAVDHFIRFETLHMDLEKVCSRLEIPWEPQRLGTYKSEYRARKEHFREYYNAEAADLVRKEFAWELECFGYSADSTSG